MSEEGGSQGSGRVGAVLSKLGIKKQPTSESTPVKESETDSEPKDTRPEWMRREETRITDKLEELDASGTLPTREGGFTPLDPEIATPTAKQDRETQRSSAQSIMGGGSAKKPGEIGAFGQQLTPLTPEQTVARSEEQYRRTVAGVKVPGGAEPAPPPMTTELLKEEGQRVAVSQFGEMKQEAQQKLASELPTTESATSDTRSLLRRVEDEAKTKEQLGKPAVVVDQVTFTPKEEAAQVDKSEPEIRPIDKQEIDSRYPSVTGRTGTRNLVPEPQKKATK